MATSNLPRRGELPNSLDHENEQQAVQMIDDDTNGPILDLDPVCHNEADQISVPEAQYDTSETASNAKTKLEHISSRY
jgi:hypothetical protein